MFNWNQYGHKENITISKPIWSSFYCPQGYFFQMIQIRLMLGCAKEEDALHAQYSLKILSPNCLPSGLTASLCACLAGREAALTDALSCFRGWFSPLLTLYCMLVWFWNQHKENNGILWGRLFFQYIFSFQIFCWNLHERFVAWNSSGKM